MAGLERLPAQDSIVVCDGPPSEAGGHHLALQAFHLLTTYHRPDARLVLAALPSWDGYGYRLNRFSHELGLRNVTFIWRRDDAQLSALYRRSAAFLALGSDAAVLEAAGTASGLGVPVVARTGTPAADVLEGAIAVGPEAAEAAIALDLLLS